MPNTIISIAFDMNHYNDCIYVSCRSEEVFAGLSIRQNPRWSYLAIQAFYNGNESLDDII
jgi:hypothetical protein